MERAIWWDQQPLPVTLVTDGKGFSILGLYGALKERDLQTKIIPALEDAENEGVN